MRFLDSHAHIFSEEFAQDFEAMLQACRDKQVERINIMCTAAQEARTAMAFAEKEPERFTVSYGIFPTDAPEVDEARWNEFLEIIQDPRCTCVGEIGLDYYWETNEENRAKQRELFIRQIEAAKAVNKPICVHARDAIQDTFDIMKEHRTRGLLHSFSGSAEMALEFTKLGYYISLGGPVTFKNARHSREVTAAIDLKYLLSETDAPYMAPEPVRGTRNAPFNIPYIVEKMAMVKEMTVEEMADIIDHNWTRFLEG